MINYDQWRNHGIVGFLTLVRIEAMRNDLELTRKILSAIREKNDLHPAPIQIPGYEPTLVKRHIKRLYDDEMIEGMFQETLSMEAPVVFVTDMTTAGHSFLALLEQQDVWNKLTSALSPSELAAFSLRELTGLAKEVALNAAKKKLGLSE